MKYGFFNIKEAVNLANFIFSGKKKDISAQISMLKLLHLGSCRKYLLLKKNSILHPADQALLPDCIPQLWLSSG